MIVLLNMSTVLKSLMTKKRNRKQIGMSILYSGAKIVFEVFLENFAGTSYDYIEFKIIE